MEVRGGGELCLQRDKTRLCGMSAHHVVAVDAVCRVLHAVVDLPPEHRQVLGKPAHTHTHNHTETDRQVCEERQVGQKQSGASCLLNNLWQSTDELILFIFSFNVLIKWIKKVKCEFFRCVLTVTQVNL